jgi:hypothetical protein
VSIARRIGQLAFIALALLVFSAPAALADGKLTVGIEGAGDVTGRGIECTRDVNDKAATGDCSEEFTDTVVCDKICVPQARTAVIVADPPAKGFQFAGWDDDCAGQKELCELVMAKDMQATAKYVDAENPTVKLTAPGAGRVRGTVLLTADAADNARVDHVTFSLGGRSVDDRSSTYSGSINTVGLKDGAATATATAFDTAGRKASSSVAVTIDNTAPTVTITGPSDQSLKPSAPLNWKLEPSDKTSPVDLVQCAVALSTVTNPTFTPCTGGTTGHSASGLADGSYTLSVLVRDAAGNSSTTTRSFKIDGTEPETTIASGLANGGATTAASLTWTLTASETGVTFACRVYPAALTPGDFAACSGGATHTASGFAPGTYTFETRATDAAGNVESTTVKRTFRVDTPPPPPPAPPAPPAAPADPAPVAQPLIQTVTNTIVAPSAVSQIVVTLGFNFKSSTKSTKLSTLVVKNIPAGSTVKVKCSKGCSKKSFKKTGASGQLSLKPMIKKALKVGTTIQVVVSKPGSSAAVKTLKIRARKAPQVTTQCQPEGASKPAAC